ncbi:MAG: hypothetical protein WBA97_09860 [Actinophytocola sp.]|uniref:hypothetical protein n=1 Tax=Actinophytocola sp. TaxID=1872138 RepID=UPI003C735E29
MSNDQVVWVPLTRDPPAVSYEGAVWLVCPLHGFDCGRMPRDLFGEQWAADVMAVHVAIHHRIWDHHT